MFNHCNIADGEKIIYFDIPLIWIPTIQAYYRLSLHNLFLNTFFLNNFTMLFNACTYSNSPLHQACYHKLDAKLCYVEIIAGFGFSYCYLFWRDKTILWTFSMGDLFCTVPGVFSFRPKPTQTQPLTWRQHFKLDSGTPWFSLSNNTLKDP